MDSNEPFLTSRDEKLVYPPQCKKEDVVRTLKHKLKSGLLYWSMKRAVKAELIKPRYSIDNFSKLIPKILEENGLKVQLQNEIYNLHQQALHAQENEAREKNTESNPTSSTQAKKVSNSPSEGISQPKLPTLSEPLTCVNNIRRNWSFFLRDQIISISRQLKVPLASPGRAKKQTKKKKISNNTKRKKRKGKISQDSDDSSDSDDPYKQEEEDEKDNPQLPKYTGVYGPSKFFETVIEITNSNSTREFNTNRVGWGLVKLELRTPSLSELRTEFAVLRPGRNVNLNDANYTPYSHKMSTFSRGSFCVPIVGPSVIHRDISKEHSSDQSGILDQLETNLDEYRDGGKKKSASSNKQNISSSNKVSMRKRKVLRNYVELDTDLLVDQRARVEKEYDLKMKELMSSGFLHNFYELCKNGVSPEHRRVVWKRILLDENEEFREAEDINPDDLVSFQDSVDSQKCKNLGRVKYFKSLHLCHKKVRLLVDDMIKNDIKRTCDDENYFVFEDMLGKVMNAFIRDPWVFDHLRVKPAAILGVSKISKRRVVYPPNGIVPFEGLSTLLAPMCYIYQDEVDLYYVFRNMYTKYFSGLHIISSRPGTLIPLCKIFEDLLVEVNPQVFYHLLELNIHPLDIAIPWIFHAFAGYLRVDQLLCLWDRVIGFDGVKVIAIFAVGIFCLRAKFVLESKNTQRILDVFRDFAAVEVVPVLQYCLFL